MDVLQILLLTLALLSAFPLGKLLAKLTQEELKACRKTFRGIIIASGSLLIISAFLNLGLNVELFAVLSLLFVIILTHESIKHSEIKKGNLTFRKKNIRKKKR